MPDAIELRPYQRESIEGLRGGVREGHRSQILMAPTGAGKGVVAAYLLQEAARKYTRAAFLVDRINLVDQTSAVLDRYGIDHGVIQAGHWRWRPYERIQICSAQTIEKRGFFPDLKLLIVDEAHAVRKQAAQLIKSRSDLTVIGLTATPFTKGLGGIFSNLVNVCTTNELIADGFLVPLKMYAARAVDMTGAKVVGGEWAEKEIEKRGLEIVGDIVSEWADKTMQHFGGPVKTLVFSATVEHGAELCRQFSAAGYNFQQISYKDGDENYRRALIEEFRKPDSQITGLISCEVFTKGFDVPDILCGIGARPYRKSLSSHIQQLGRVMRPSPGKEFGLWLDHCGNVLRFKADTDEIFQHGMKSLKDGERDTKVRKEPTPKEREQIRCSCGYLFEKPMPVCPCCGKERARLGMVETIAGIMEEVTSGGGTKTAKKKAFLKDKEAVWRQLCSHACDRKRGDRVKAEKWAKAQFKGLYDAWPAWPFSSGFTDPMSPELKGEIDRRFIAYIKRTKAKAAAHA